MKMKKVVSLLLVVVFVLAFSSVAFAFSVNMNNGLENSPVFAETYSGVYMHTESPVGFDAESNRMRIPPAEPGLNSADQSNVNVNPWNPNHSSVGDLP